MARIQGLAEADLRAREGYSVTEMNIARDLTEEEARPARGRPRDTEKNSAIIDAASQLFLENGFDGTSMDEVAKRAGVSKQTVYSHFSSKEQLFSEAIHLTISTYFPENALKGVEHHTLEADLTAVAGKFGRLLMSPDAMAMHRVLVAAAPKGPAFAQMFWNAGPAEMNDKLAEFLKTWAERGELAIENFEEAAGRLITLLKGKAHFMLEIGLIDHVSDEDLAAQIKDAVACFLKIYRR